MHASICRDGLQITREVIHGPLIRVTWEIHDHDRTVQMRFHESVCTALPRHTMGRHKAIQRTTAGRLYRTDQPGRSQITEGDGGFGEARKNDKATDREHKRIRGPGSNMDPKVEGNGRETGSSSIGWFVGL